LAQAHIRLEIAHPTTLQDITCSLETKDFELHDAREHHKRLHWDLYTAWPVPKSVMQLRQLRSRIHVKNVEIRPVVV
jgi:hypothetical protein